MAAKKNKKKQESKAQRALKGMLVEDDGDKQALLDALAARCNAALGKSGAVMRGSEQRPFVRRRTGITALDYVTGGGLVEGQMFQFTGADSCFKTSAAMVCTAAVQQAGGTAVWVAGEGFDKAWAYEWGVDLDKLIVITADMGDTAMEAAVTLIQSGLVDIMTFDSIQSLGTTREMEGGVDDEAYAGAGAPQMWGRVMRKTYAAMNAGARTSIIAISQVRSAIGKFSQNGPPEPEGSGIYALKHWKAADIYFRKGELFYEGTADEKRRITGREFKVRCIKNKTAASERQASFELSYGPTAIDNTGTLFRLACAYELIEIKGSWFSGYGLREQGKEPFIEKLRDEPAIQDEMTEHLLELVG